MPNLQRPTPKELAQPQLSRVWCVGQSDLPPLCQIGVAEGDSRNRADNHLKPITLIECADGVWRREDS